MKTEILIATWSKDIEYLKFNLRSIQKFASGFEGTTLLVAQQETPLFDPIASEFGCRVATYDRVADAARWHLQHQAEKCRADIHCPEADLILFTDSDCVFTEAVTPEDYLVDGRPVLLMEEFSRLTGNPWKPTVDAALGIDAKYELMRRHPAVHWRAMFMPFRAKVEMIHKKLFEDYVTGTKPNFPWGYSEFVSLGAYVHDSAIWSEKYHFIDVACQPRPKDKLMQFWSHAPIDQPQDLPSGGRGCPIETYRRLGLA